MSTGSRMYAVCGMLLILSSVSFGAIRYMAPVGTYPGAFSTAQAAHDASNNGDTIYVMGGSYSTLISTKRLTWIGPGAYLTRPGTQASQLLATFSDVVTFNAGSEGSMVQGLYFYKYGFTYLMYINCDSVTLRRCIFVHGRSDVLLDTLRIRGNNVTIEQCLIGEKVTLYEDYHDLVFRNNIIGGYVLGGYANLSVLSTNGWNAIYQNVLNNFESNIARSEVFNNVFDRTYNAVFTGCSVYNNVSCGTLPAGNGNISNVLSTSLFVGGSNDDAQWQLSAASPARAAGIGGVDCGAFGGTNPYVLSLMPAIPSISSVSLPGFGTPASGLSITIQATAHP